MAEFIILILGVICLVIGLPPETTMDWVFTVAGIILIGIVAGPIIFVAID